MPTDLSDAIKVRLTKIKLAAQEFPRARVILDSVNRVQTASSWDNWQAVLAASEDQARVSAEGLGSVAQLRGANLKLALFKTAIHAAYGYATDPQNATGKYGRGKDVAGRITELVGFYQAWMENKAKFQVAIGVVDSTGYLFLPEDQGKVMTKLAGDQAQFVEWLDVEPAASVTLSPRDKRWGDLQERLADADPGKFDQVQGRRVDPFVQWQKSFQARYRLSPRSLVTEKGNLDNFTSQVTAYKAAIDVAYSYALQSQDLGGWKELSQAVREVDWPERLLVINEHQSRWQSWQGLCEQWRIFLQSNDDQMAQCQVRPDGDEIPVGALETEIRDALDQFKFPPSQVSHPRPRAASQETVVKGQAITVDRDHYSEVDLKDPKEKSTGCFTMPSKSTGIGLFALGGGAAAATLLLTFVGKMAAIATVSAIAWPVTVFLLAMGAGIIYHHYKQGKTGLFKSGEGPVDGFKYTPDLGPGAK